MAPARKSSDKLIWIISIILVVFVVCGFASGKFNLKCDNSAESFNNLYGVPALYQADVDYLPTVGQEPTGEGGFVDEDDAYDPTPTYVGLVNPPGSNYDWSYVPDGGEKYFYNQHQCRECVSGCLYHKYILGDSVDLDTHSRNLADCKNSCYSRCVFSNN